MFTVRFSLFSQSPATRQSRDTDETDSQSMSDVSQLVSDFSH